MKKNYFKKSLSLFMAVLMLMTCWVWVAPEKAEAYSASDVYTSLDTVKTNNENLIKLLTGSTTINTTYGKYFPGDTTDVSKAKDLYINVIWSGQSKRAAYIGETTIREKALESFGIYYPETVLMYDGINNPQFGISMHKDAMDGHDAVHYGTIISNTNTTNLSLNGGSNNQWFGVLEQKYSSHYFLDAYYSGNNYCGYTNSVDKMDDYNYDGKTGNWYTFATLVQYSGSMKDSEYNITVTPTFQTHLGQKKVSGFIGIGSKAAKQIKPNVTLENGGVPVHIINTKPLKAAYNQVDNIKKMFNEDTTGEIYKKYTPASVEEFKNLANALTAANPNNTSKFNWSNTASAVSTYASVAKAAVDAWNGWYKDGKGGLVEIKEIKWKDGDGKTLKTEYRGVDQTATYSGTTPTKTPDPTGYNDAGDKGWQYTYTFNKTWTTATTVDSATNRKIETHTANFDRITNFYVVTFDLSGDRTDVVKTYTLGSTIPLADIPALSKRDPDNDYHFSYKWDPAIGAVTKDITYKEILAEPEGHSFGAWEEVTPPTCSEEGLQEHFCTVCNWRDEVDIPATGKHDITKIKAYKDSTCTEEGNIDYWQCKTCKKYFSDEEGNTEISLAGTVITKKDHVYGAPIKNSGNEDYHLLKCNTCDDYDEQEHTYIPDLDSETSATCIVPGTTTDICAFCDRKKVTTGQTDPDNHENIVVINAKAPTCDEPGYTGDKVCLACDPDGLKILEKGEEIPELGHKFNGAYVSNNNGTHVQKCTNANCDATGNEQNCTYGAWTTDNAETHSHTCTACNYTPNAENHNWTAWTPAEDNTENAPGKMTRECTVCGRTETIDCTNYEVVDHIDANCVDAEETTYQCSDCGHTYKVIGDPALGHDYTGTIIDNGNGTHSYLCKNGCGTYGATVDCSNWVADGNNCKCSDCDYTKAHAWGKWVNNSDNVADAPGKMTRTCSVCNATDTTDCTYDSVYTAPTCTQDAYTTYTCKDENCGHGYTVIDKGSATGHNFTGEYKFDEAEDKHQQLCANGCGAYGVGTEADKWADCTWSYTNKEDGKHTATCECGNSEEQACSGGTATCTDKATCEFCKTAYGSKADHLFEGDVVALGNGNHAYRCKFCKDQTIYGVGNNVGDSVPCSGGSATCTTLATCEECKASYGELKADAHKWGTPVPEKNDTEHTHKYTCEYNGEHTKTEACAPAVDSVVAPTCEVPGYTVQKCQLCSATWNTDPTEALGHSWGDWVSNKNGTHTRTCVRLGCCYGENGAAKTETAYCTKENATVVVTDPTCTEGGFSTYTCNLCGYDWVDDNTAALGHDYSNKIYREEYLFEEQNCTEGNIYFYACSRCNKNGKDETDLDKYTNLKFEADKPLGHKWVEKVDGEYKISDATCTTAAKYYKSCEVCGEKSEETFTVTEAFGHSNWVKPTDDEIANDENLLAVKADCETDAQYYYVCERCRVSSKGLKTDGETWTVVSSKPGHSTLIEVKGVAGNCEKDTTIAHWYCKDCGKKFKDANGDEAFVGSTIIKAPGHSWIKYSAVDATCETDGHAAYDKCSVCGATKGTPTVYPKKGHNFTADAGYYIDEVNDYHAFYCANAKCLPATDDNGEAIKDAKGRSVYNKAYGIAVDGQQVKYTVTDNGDGTVTVSGGIKCSFDNSTITTVDGVHSHNDVCVCSNSISTVYTDESPKTVAPTCVDYGYKLHTCSVCKATWQTDMVEPNGHTLATTGVSNGDGTHSLKCTVDTCSYKKDTVKCSGGTATCKDQAVCDICSGPYGDTLPHTLSDSGWIYNGNAKCGVDGTESQKCSVCGETETRTKVGSALNHELLGEYTYDISGWESKPADFNLDIKEPNCKENGLTINYCTNAGCGYYKTKIVKASASYHKFTETTTAGTCTTGAVTTKVCRVCNYTERTTSEAADHQWMETGRDLPNCTNSGCIYYLCTVCKEEVELDEITADFTDSNYVMFMGMKVDISGIKAKGHKWGNLEIEKAATCSREGRGNHSCNVCGKGEKVDIPVIEGAHIIGHKNCTLKRVPASAPTCKAQGNREYYECMSCPYSQNANDDYTLDPVGHKDNDGDGRCDYCYDPMDKATINDGCICHKTGFSAFIYKILRIFWKLFKIKKSCDCGAVHY